jgi:putative restriction endonuclease
MRYWWVNQNQTYRQEVQGGYLWSPKRSASGVRNPFYESMREVSPGDLVFSFKDTRIQAIGIAQSYCWESPKPIEFGSAGQNWENIGWKVKVTFTELAQKIRPKDHIDVLRPLLPPRYSPLQPSGNGLQSVYLTEIPLSLAEVIMGLIGQEVEPLALAAKTIKPVAVDDIEFWERKLEQQVTTDSAIPDTERTALIRARKGQGLFKERVSQIETKCRLTGVQNSVHLIASHCKPWRDSSNEERLNGENGLLLTPSIDHLFDRGFIGFEDNGRLIISPVAHSPSLERMGIKPVSPSTWAGSLTGKNHSSISIGTRFCYRRFGNSRAAAQENIRGFIQICYGCSVRRIGMSKDARESYYGTCRCRQNLCVSTKLRTCFPRSTSSPSQPLYLLNTQAIGSGLL